MISQLKREWEEGKADWERYNLTLPGILDPQPLPELKVWGKGRKGGIDWFIYRECIQILLLYPLVVKTLAE